MVNQPQTLGEHLLNRRLKLGLRQEDVAGQLDTMREVYERWERDEREPVISEWPGILSFLGYYPGSDKTDADLVLKARRCRGFNQKQMAKTVGVIHQILRRWERGEKIPSCKRRRQFKRYAQIQRCSNVKHALNAVAIACENV